MSAKDKFKEKYYVEIKPDSEIVRVGKKGDLKTLAEIGEESKQLPNKGSGLGLPSPESLVDGDVCGHWHRVPIHITEVDFKLYKIIGSDVIVGGYCPDCNETFSKKEWVR